MENRKKLHDYSIVLICFSVLNLVTAVATFFAGYFGGAYDEALKSVDASIVGAVKVGIIIVGMFIAFLALSDAFIGIKGLKVSREPNAYKGYITVAKIFLVLNIIGTISFTYSLFDANVDIIDSVLNLACTAVDVVLYALFINAANAVRFEATKK